MAVPMIRELNYAQILSVYRIKQNYKSLYWLGLYHPHMALKSQNVSKRRQGWQWTDGSVYTWMGSWKNDEPGKGENVARIAQAKGRKWAGTRNYNFGKSTTGHFGPYKRICEMGKGKSITITRMGKLK